MNKFNSFIEKYFKPITLVLLLAIFLHTCNRDTKTTNKKVDSLTAQIDSLKSVVASKSELKIEGLKSEKRMIQSTDRKILDVNRQSEIDKEIQSLSK